MIFEFSIIDLYWKMSDRYVSLLALRVGRWERALFHYSDIDEPFDRYKRLELFWVLIWGSG